MSSGLSRLARRRIVFSLAVILLLSAAGFVWRAWLNANAALRAGRETAASAGRVTVRTFPLPIDATPFEPVLTAAEFRSAAEYQGDLYVCGSSALFKYREGVRVQTWRVGRDLPAHPLTSLAVRTGIGNPELWIATDGGGILIYDGNGFRQVLPEPVSVRKISSMLPLSNGSVLVGTKDAGLYISDGKSFRTFHPRFTNTQVTYLAGDQDGFWVGTRGDGAWHWRGGEAIHTKGELPDPQVLSIVTRGDKAWIGTPVGIAEFTGDKLERHLAEGLFAQALAERNGTLWVGTPDQGTVAIPLETRSPRPQLMRMQEPSINASAFVEWRDMLAGITARQIVDLSTGQSLVAAGDDLTSAHITALETDSRGRLWIGYFDRGFDILPAVSGNGPQHLESDVLFCINRIRESPADGAIAVATANGLAMFDTNGRLREILDSKSGLIANSVTDVLFRPDMANGRSMVIATSAGLSFLDHGSFASLYAFHGLANNHVYTLAEVNGILYAGTLGGISTIRNGLVQASFSTANSALHQNWITASAVIDGQLYLGTYGSGVIRFDQDGAVTSFRAFAGGRVEINANAMLVTTRALYAGTAGRGLAILRRGDDRWQFVTDGLPSANVTAIAARDGQLYVGTDNGLVRVLENNLLP